MESIGDPEISDVKIEIDVAEEPQPQWMNQDPFPDPAISDIVNTPGMTSAHHKTEACSQRASFIKSEPNDNGDTYECLMKNPSENIVDNNTFHVIKYQTIDKTKQRDDIKPEQSTSVEFFSTSMDTLNGVNYEQSEIKMKIKEEVFISTDVTYPLMHLLTGVDGLHSDMKSCSSTVHVKSEPFTYIEPDTRDVECNFRREEVTVKANDDIRLQAVPANSTIIVDTEMKRANMNNVVEIEDLTADTSVDIMIADATTKTVSDVKSEPYQAHGDTRTETMEASTSNNAKTESIMDEMMMGMPANRFRSLIISKLDGDTNQQLDDDQENEEKEEPSSTDHHSGVKQLKEHKMIHTGQTPYACDVCNKTFTRAQQLKEHKMIHTGKTPFACDVCNKTFTQAQKLKEHKMIHTGQKPFTCDVCGKMFRQTSNLSRHKKVHTDQKIEDFIADTSIDTNIADTTTKTVGNVKSEPYQAHGDTRTETMEASTSNNAKTESIMDEMMMRMRANRFRSQLIPKLDGDTNQQLDDDQENEEKEEPSLTDHHSGVKQLKEHKMIHTGQSPYACDECNKTFRQMRHLKQHKMFHTGQKPFACDVCNKTFARSGSLKRHNMVHTGQKPFACDVCSKTFTRAERLKEHKMIHTGQKAFACNVCGKMFRNISNLSRHGKVHTDQKPFTCDLCGQTFKRVADLKDHKITHKD